MTSEIEKLGLKVTPSVAQLHSDPFPEGAAEARGRRR